MGFPLICAIVAQAREKVNMASKKGIFRLDKSGFSEYDSA